MQQYILTLIAALKNQWILRDVILIMTLTIQALIFWFEAWSARKENYPFTCAWVYWMNDANFREITILNFIHIFSSSFSPSIIFSASYCSPLVWYAQSANKQHLIYKTNIIVHNMQVIKYHFFQQPHHCAYFHSPRTGICIQENKIKVIRV